jgi:hypothetical protein
MAGKKLEQAKKALNFCITWKGYAGRGEAISEIMHKQAS